MNDHRYYYDDYSCFPFEPGTEVSVDLETTGLDPKRDKICFLSLSIKEDESWVFSWPMEPGSLQWLMNPKVTKIFHHAKFDISFLNQAGFVINNFTDTQLMAYHYDNRNCSHMSALKYLAKKCLGKEETTTFVKLLPKKDRDAGKTIMDVPIDLVVPYAGDDAIYTFGLYHYFNEKIEELDEAEKKMVQSSLAIDLQIATILKNMQLAGCKMNTPKLLDMQQECNKKVAEHDSIISKWLPEKIVIEVKRAGEFVNEEQDFNINSTKHKQELFYQKWNLPIIEFTEKGQFATDDNVLAQLERYHPAIPFMRERATYTKLLSTYLGPFAEYTKEDGILYGSYNQTNAITGRLSSSSPNLQNIPIKTDMGKELRNCWVSRFENGRLVVADHSQIEMRVMGHFCGDIELIKAIKNGEDLHAATARNIFNVKEPTKEQRSVGKTINFGIIYGMGARTLAISLGISLSEAQDLLEAFFRVYIGIKDYMATQQGFAKERGYVETMLGRRLNIHSYDYTGTRAVNYPIQGSAAEILKLGMIEVAENLQAYNLKSKLILQVHDELVIDAPEDEVDTVSAGMETLMLRTIPKLKVPLAVNVVEVECWGEAK